MIGFILYESFELAYYVGLGTYRSLSYLSSWILPRHPQIQDIEMLEEEDLMDERKELYDKLEQLEQRIQSLEKRET